MYYDEESGGASFLTGVLIALFIAWSLGRANRTAFALREALEDPHARAALVTPEGTERLDGGEVAGVGEQDGAVDLRLAGADRGALADPGVGDDPVEAPEPVGQVQRPRGAVRVAEPGRAARRTGGAT